MLDQVLILGLLQRAQDLRPCLVQKEENGTEDKEMFNSSKSTRVIGFNVKNAMFFPPEVEKGIWPENYVLSDHAYLTVEFSLQEMNSTWERFLFSFFFLFKIMLSQF